MPREFDVGVQYRVESHVLKPVVVFIVPQLCVP